MNNEYGDRIRRVKKLARKVFKKEKLSVPVDIEKLIEKYATLTIEDIPFADAICCDVESNPVIMYSSDVLETRLRFTLAHELGHIKIPWHIGMISCHTDEDYEEEVDQYEYKQIEIQANTFASELLIPSDWVKEKIEEKKLIKFDTIIEYICDAANVSFQASLYSLINSLPDDYFVKIERKDKDYSQDKIAQNIEICQLKDKLDNFHRYKYLSEWIEFNAIDSGKFQAFNEEVFWVKFSKTIEDDHLKELLNYHQGDIDNLFNTIFNVEKYSLAINIKKVCDNLPKGYIVYIQSKNGGCYNMLLSKDTHIKPYSNNNLIDEMILWCDENSDNSGVFIIGDFSINWYRFDVDDEYIDIEDDNRKSKEVFKDILDRHFIYGKQRQYVSGTINGTISFQYDRKNYNKEKLYGILKQKFLGREDLKDIIDDDEFNIYLAKKTKELEEKKLSK